MTAHPIDTEALRASATEAIEAYGPAAWPDIRSADLLALLDALAAAERRATRAEAQVSEEKRLRMRATAAATEAEAERDEWRQTALDERGAALDALEQVKAREARIKAVRDVHYPAHNDQDRTPFCETCKGAPGVHECGCWQDEQQAPVCGHCRGWKGVGSVDWPCATIRALEG